MSSSETPPAATPEPAAPGRTKTLVKKIVYSVLAVVFGVIALAKIITWNELPGCDSKSAKDTLSDLFKQKNIDVARYNEIATVSTSDNQVVCKAELTLTDRKRILVEYNLVKEDSGMRLNMVVKEID